MFKIIIKGQDQLQKVGNALRNPELTFYAALSQNGYIAVEQIKSRIASEFPKEAQRLDVMYNVDLAGFTVEVFAKDDVGKFLVFGTKAHYIEPASASVLKIDGGTFSHGVYVKGIEPIVEDLRKIVLDELANLNTLLMRSVMMELTHA